MNLLKPWRRIAASILLTAVFAGETIAQTTVGPVPITKIRTGWGADIFAIETGQTISNPANCSTPDGYLLESSHPGYKTHYAAVLTAFAMGKQVMIVVSDAECVIGRPKLWGIYMPQQ